MKHLLNGVAIAAALAIAVPAWAQAPMTPAPTTGQPSPTKGMPKAGTPSASTGTAISKEQMAAAHHKHMMRRAARRAPVATSADQLNHEEMVRLQGGGAMPAPTGSGPYGQPNNTRGIPGAGTAPATAPTN
jgi:hypothetical protein